MSDVSPGEISGASSGEEIHYKVKVPTDSVIPLRQVEPGIKLSKDVTTDSGQLIYPKGTNLSEQNIRKLESFERRYVHIRTSREKWVDESTYSNLPDSTECLRTKVVPDEPGDEEHHTVSEVFDLLKETDSPDRIKNVLDNLKETVETEEQDKDLEQLEQKIERAHEPIRFLLNELTSLGSDELQTLRQCRDEKAVGGKKQPVSNDVEAAMLGLQTLFEQKDDVKNSVMEKLHQAPKLFSKMNRTTPEESGSESIQEQIQDVEDRLVDSLGDWDRGRELLQLLDEQVDNGTFRLSDLIELIEGQDTGSTGGDLDQEEFTEENLNAIRSILELGFSGEETPPSDRSLKPVRNKNLEGEIDDSLTGDAPPDQLGKEPGNVPSTQDDPGRDDLHQLVDELAASLEKSLDSDQERTIQELRETVEQLSLAGSQNTLIDELYRETVPHDKGIEDKTKSAGTRGGDDPETSSQASRKQLPETVLGSFRNLYSEPGKLNKWQEKLLTTHKTILERMMSELEVPENAVKKWLHRFFKIIEKETKLFSLFVQPPNPERYHLAHSFNVTLLSLIIGQRLSLQQDKLRELALGSVLADIGLTLIPDSFYLKAGKLTQRAEKELLKHPGYSRNIVEVIEGLSEPVKRIVYRHHERADGSGYPEGRAIDNLSRLDLIVGCADVYTALIEDRTYRSKWTPDRALKCLQDAGDRYDPEVVRTIRGVLGYYPNGSLVKLSNRKLAYVKAQNEDDPSNPEVFLLTDENRNKLQSPEKCNLAEGKETVEIVLKSDSVI